MDSASSVPSDRVSSPTLSMRSRPGKRPRLAVTQWPVTGVDDHAVLPAMALGSVDTYLPSPYGPRDEPDELAAAFGLATLPAGPVDVAIVGQVPPGCPQPSIPRRRAWPPCLWSARPCCGPTRPELPTTCRPQHCSCSSAPSHTQIGCLPVFSAMIAASNSPAATFVATICLTAGRCNVRFRSRGACRGCFCGWRCPSALRQALRLGCWRRLDRRHQRESTPAGAGPTGSVKACSRRRVRSWVSRAARVVPSLGTLTRTRRC
jgi:hypothetical protein